MSAADAGFASLGRPGARRVAIAFGLWSAALAAAAGAVALTVTSSHVDDVAATATLSSSVGLAFVAAGLTAWLRRPQNRVGALMAATGFAWFLGALQAADDPALFSVGAALSELALGFFAWLVLAYPSGRLESRLNRSLAVLAFVDVVGVQIVHRLFARSDRIFRCDGCPENVLAVYPSDTAALAVESVFQALALVVVGAVTWIIVRRLRVATPALRRAIAPFFVASGATVVLLGLTVALTPASREAADAFSWVALPALLSVPLAFLFGLVRERIARSAVGRLVVQLAGERTPEIQDELRAALGDPTVRIAYWLVDERIWVDIEGRPVPPPVAEGKRFTTTVERNGQPVAVLEHDVALLDDRALLDGVASAAGLALENERRLQELRRSEARNRALLDAMPDLMFRISADGRYLDYKAESTRDLYVPEVVGLTVDERLPPVLAGRILAAGRRAIATGEAQALEYELDFDGGVRTYEGRAVASGDDEFLLIVRDFSERREREQALAESEARNRALVDAIPDLLFRIGRDGVYRDVKADDPAALMLPPERIVGSDIRDVLPRPVAERILRAGERARETGALETVDYALQIRGEPRYFEGRIAPSAEDEFLLIVRDFTERRRQDEELRLLHRQLELRLIELERERDFTRTVVNAAPSILMVVDEAGRVMRFNRRCEELTGHPDGSEVRGRPFWEAFADRADAAAVQAAFEEVAAGGEPHEHESRWLTRGGERLVVAWSATPLADEDGRLRFLIAGSDVTERTRQAEELRASRARIVEAGDAARRRLERNLHDGAQQRLVSLSLALRLAETKLSSDPAGAAQLLAGAREELALALQELRELARGIHPAILSERGLSAALETLAARSAIPVRLETPEERLPEPVEAAAYYVVSEALANVAKYAEASEVEVRVARENGRALVEVRDDGVGGADPARGTGLRGLADRVEALAGRLEVESEPGGGTRVSAEFPVG